VEPSRPDPLLESAAWFQPLRLSSENQPSTFAFSSDPRLESAWFQPLSLSSGEKPGFKFCYSNASRYAEEEFRNLLSQEDYDTRFTMDLY
jgi:hypothetical protein